MDFVLVLDLSSSMLQQTAAGRSKLAAAVEAAQRFLDTIHLGEGDQAALVAFNAEAWLVTPLTDDRADLDAGFAGLATAQFTRIDRGIAVAQEELTGSRRRGENLPVMVVLTDGRNNPVPVQAAVDQAQQAKAAGTQLFTIGIGQDLEVAALAQMASRPEWFYVAPDAEDLGSIYLAIAEAIPCPAETFWGSR
jgi:Mg-chelatase subunit ChlD